MTDTEFAQCFKNLTGNAPFPWQTKLFREWFSKGEFPPSCDLPTGLGKTSVMAIWLIALAGTSEGVPRRLIYVVNRRTVVDQATDEAKKLRDNLETSGLAKVLRGSRATDQNVPLAISTLRGQFADNREWSADPARPAIIVGTVDMIGSRLLFSGYGVGFKAKPLHAGFLGQDALLVHDEAHLEPAFQELIERIECEQNECEPQRCKTTGNLPWPKLRVMQLTATTRNGTDQTANREKQENQRPFGLTDEDRSHPIAQRRIEAKKHLAFTPVADDKAVAQRVAILAEKYKDAQAAVLVFVRQLEDIDTVNKHLSKTKREVVLLTGTMRGKERDDLVEKPDFKRFLKGAPSGDTVYLVCTSAGEVGIDISADHMICDLSTFESMAQRLGRVNRYGEPIGHVARIDVVHPTSFGKTDKKTGELKTNEIDKRRQKTLELLKELPSLGEDQHDASPKALDELRQRTDPSKIQDAFAPPPIILPATDILFDAWAMTTIQGKMPGRPEVGPYLHGIADDRPQTTIAWRIELDLVKDAPDPVAKSKLQAIFTKHRVRPHESLTLSSHHIVKFLKDITATKVRPDLLDTRVALIFTRNLELTTIKALIDNPSPLNVDPTLILPASFGGLDDKGMLSAPKPDNKEKKTDITDDDAAGEENGDAAAPESTLDIADIKGYERDKGAKPRLRVLIERAEKGWQAKAIPGATALSSDWNFEDPSEKSTPLIKRIQGKSGLKIRLMQPIASDGEGEPIHAIICLSPPPKQGHPTEEQLLIDHVAAVRHEAGRLADALLQNDKIANAALQFAAKWHDEGKKADRWQRYIGGPDNDGQPLGKSAQWRDSRLLAGYRHEFGSLLRIPNDEALAFFTDPKRQLTADQQEDALELALHLIAAHHGYARPHFAHLLDDDFNTAECEQTHVHAIRRFACLQRKYGRWGLAYLESLLRAADWAASAVIGIDVETNDDDTSEADGGDA